MSFASSRRIMFSSLVVLLIISLLHIWLCCDCQAGAMRIFPGNGVGEEKGRHQMKARKSNEDLFRKFFNGRAFAFNRTAKGFDESKRRVPSCPDPLHNKQKTGGILVS
ncbi:hypothetical protein AAG906_031819 [Vitis piasezkii]